VPRITVAGDGTLAAIVEPTRIVIVSLPDGTAQTEVGLDRTAASEVAWVGTPPRLLVLARHAAHTTVHLLDVPAGAPRSLAEIRLETPMRLFAAVGAHALVIGSLGAAILTAFDAHLMPYQFLSRSVPVAAGAAGAQFVVALPGTIEEWDPASRTPKRRLRLPRPATIRAVGGSDRVVWMTTQHDPARIEVLPLVNRGQPKTHELPEPIAAVHGHPRSDLIACTGESGRLYIVDLDGRTRLRTIAADGVDRVEAAGLVVGRMIGVIAAQVHRPLAIIPLDGRELEPVARAQPTPTVAEAVDPDDLEPARVSTLTHEPPPEPAPAPLPIASEPERPSVRAAPPPPESPPEPRPTAAPRAPWSTGSPNFTERFSALRERGQKPRDDSPPIRASWRDDVVLWTRSIVAGAFDKAAPVAPPIETLAVRLELPAPLVPALVLLYGVHLAGHHGAAPVDVARVLGRSWDEALGRGRFAALGLATYERSRVILATPLQLALDELPPTTGTLVGTPSSAVALLGSCVVVARGGEPLAAIAERLVETLGGAILAAHAGGDPHALLLEARVLGAAPLSRASDQLARTEPMIVVVDSDEQAERLGLPVVA
jgi:hypothetical protein